MRATLTRSLAFAAGWDAGNASMRAAGRDKWNEDDYNAAARETNRLLHQLDQPALPGEPKLLT